MSEEWLKTDVGVAHEGPKDTMGADSCKGGEVIMKPLIMQAIAGRDHGDQPLRL